MPNGANYTTVDIWEQVQLSSNMRKDGGTLSLLECNNVGNFEVNLKRSDYGTWKRVWNMCGGYNVEKSSRYGSRSTYASNLKQIGDVNI